MSAERALVLAVAVVVAFLLLRAYAWYRTRWGPHVERLAVDDLGLELMSGCCAFVVFTTSTCRPCKAAIQVVQGAAERSRGLTEVTTVDALERSDLALRYDVRTVPTVFLITASGHVVHRWKDVPRSDDVDAALAAL